MPHRRSRLRLGTGLSLTRRDRALRGLGRDPGDLADRARAAPRGLAGRHRVDLAGIRRRLDRADRHLVDRAVLRDLAHRAALAGRVDIRDRVGLVDPADRVDPAGRVDLGMNPVNLVDRHRRRTHPEARSNGVARRWAAPGMCRTASAPPITVRRRRLHNTDGVGMADRHRERRRLSGMDRRPRVAGTVHRLPVVGMSDGMGRRATKALPSVISDHSITTVTARFQCSTQCSVDGASGSSVSGFRCTDAT
jgi:hypothetical protein